MLTSSYSSTWLVSFTGSYTEVEPNSNLQISFLLFGREDSAEILASVWQEEENFEVLKRCYIQIYPTSF